MSGPGESTPSGWYDDGSGTGTHRYWDGWQWTAETRPASSAANPYASQSPWADPAQPGTAYPPQNAVGPPRTKPHAIAWIALGLAIAGFVFACIPGALIVGWVLLPIAFILSIVSFFLQGRKWPGITALILSVIGTIVGVIVFLTVVSSSFDEAFGGSDVDVDSGTEQGTEQSEPSDDDEPNADEDDGEQPAGDVGSRENPAPIGSTITGDEYEVVINSVDLDATETVLDANQFNEPPPDGSSYALVNATITYIGEESGNTFMVDIAYVASTGEVHESYDSPAVPPDPQLGMDELYNGGTAAGNVVVTVPTGDDGLIRVQPGMLADEVFVALQ